VKLTLPVLYDAVDRAIERQDRQGELHGQSVSCTKGCTHCCYLLVTAMFVEAVSIIRHLRDQGRLDEFLRVEGPRLAQLAEVMEHPDTNTLSYVQRHERCPMLAPNGTCTVYEQRPLTCRCYSVISDPRDCAVPGGDVLVPDRRQLRGEGLEALLHLSSPQVPPTMLPLPVGLQWGAILVLQGEGALRALLRGHPGNPYEDPDRATLYWARLETMDGKTYDIRTTEDGEAIGCRVCGTVSYHPEDVAHRYCGSCHLYHEQRQRGAPPKGTR